MAESLTTFGLIAFVAAQVAGIVFLVWEIRRIGWGGKALCLVSIGSSLIVLTIVLLLAWWFWHLFGDNSNYALFFCGTGVGGAALSAGR
jgi:hypothetical protein